MKNVLFIMGTRPEAIKMLPVYLELKRDDSYNPIIVSTGQHDTMIDQVFEVFQIYPDIRLELKNSEDGSLNNLASTLFANLQPVFSKLSPHIVMVQGDTLTAFVGAVVSFHQCIPLYYIEAGLRTNDLSRPFPEEGYRQMISRIATFNFTPTEEARSNLINEGLNNSIITGNTVVDALHIIKKNLEKDDREYRKKFSNLREIVLVTGHRRENFGTGLENICTAIKHLAQKYDQVDFVYPVHLNPNVKLNVFRWLKDIPNIKLTDPFSYDELIYLMMKSRIIISDSGGIQEEAPTFGVPILVTRETTERPEAVKAGLNHLVGTDVDKIKDTFDLVYERGLNETHENPYGDGKASEKIVDFLVRQ